MIKVGLLGGGGLVGQTYQKLISKHRGFELCFIPSREALEDVSKARGCDLIFSALPNSAAEVYDPLYARAGYPVFSSASCHRMEEDIPLIIPEINPEDFAWIERQQKNRGWDGFIVAKPNCTLQGMILPLFPLHKRFRLSGISVTYLQARSGAGKGFELEGNILPFIEGEEEKSTMETHKILGDSSIHISAQCMRVPISHGHLAAISARFQERPSLEEVKTLWDRYEPVSYLEEADRPQPALDLGDGMVVSIGRLSACPLMDVRFVSLSHNLIRGAAGGGLLTAEYWSKNVRTPAAV